MNRLLLLACIIVSTSLAFLDFGALSDPRYDCFYKNCKKWQKCAKCMVEREIEFQNSKAKFNDQQKRALTAGDCFMKTIEDAPVVEAFKVGYVYGVCSSQFVEDPRELLGV